MAYWSLQHFSTNKASGFCAWGSLSPSNNVARKIFQYTCRGCAAGLRERAAWGSKALETSNDTTNCIRRILNFALLSARASCNNRCPISFRQQWALDLRTAHKETCHSLSQPRPHDPTDTHGHTGTSLCPAPTHTDAACLPLCCMPQICSAAAAPRTMVCCGNQTWPKMICESLAAASLVKLRSKKLNMCQNTVQQRLHNWLSPRNAQICLQFSLLGELQVCEKVPDHLKRLH